MAKKKIKPINYKKTGRPKLDIDKSKVTYLCELYCTQEEIAGILDISQDTLIRTIQSWGFASFAEFFKRYSANGKLSLRRAQFLSATNGNIVMQKHLGINWLKQKTKENEDSKENLDNELVITIERKDHENLDMLNDSDIRILREKGHLTPNDILGLQKKGRLLTIA